MSAGAPEEQLVAAALQRTELLGQQGREEDGLRLLAEALESSPENSDLLAQRAWLLNRLSRPEEAGESARAALRGDPDNWQGLFQLANSSLIQQDHAQAEQVLLHMLELRPEDPLPHQQLAMTLTAPFESRTRSQIARHPDGKRSRDLAYAHSQRALELAPDDPDGYATAAHVIAVFSTDWDEALRYADQGLALAPEHLGLLQARAVVVEEQTANGTERGGRRAAHAAGVAEADRILRLDPGNSISRQRLFEVMWIYRTSLVDVPLAVLAVLAFNTAIMFVNDAVILLLPGVILAAIMTAVQASRYRRIASRVNGAFRRSLVHHTRLARLRIALGALSWTVALLSGVALLFVRDAVQVRWLIVALGVGVLAALAASLLWHASYPEASQRAGGATNDWIGIEYASRWRLRLLLRLLLRVLVAATALALLIGEGFRTDALALAYMAFAATLLPPLVGLIATGLTERRRVQALPEGTAVRIGYRPPRVSRLVVTGVLALVAATVLVLNLTALPVLPNEYDEVGTYRSGSDSDGCQDEQVTEDGCEEDEPEVVRDADPAIPTYEPFELPTFEPPPVVVTPVP
jgi:tetratricopeptide (TPR) repeat protein